MLMFGQYQSYHDFLWRTNQSGPLQKKKEKKLKMHSTNLYRFCKKVWSLRVYNIYTYSYMPQNIYTKLNKCFET